VVNERVDSIMMITMKGTYPTTSNFLNGQVLDVFGHLDTFFLMHSLILEKEIHALQHGS
jgi:hypothetical protein